MASSEAPASVTQRSNSESVQQLQDFTDHARKLTEQLKTDRLRRESNVNAKQPTEEELMSCDSSFKKNNGLIRKLKGITSKDKEALIAEINRVNQTKYVSEVVTALAEASVKGKDVPAAVEICTLLHHRYSEFAQGIKEALIKNYFSKGTTPEDSKTSMARRRSCLRLFLELYLAGVFEGLSSLMKIVKELTLGEYEKNPDLYLIQLTLLSAFVKTGRIQIFHLPPQLPQLSEEALSEAEEVNQELNEELDLIFKVSENESTEFMNIVKRSMSKSFETLLAEHKKLRDLENENTNVLNIRGELPENLAQEYEERRRAFDELHRQTCIFAESLDQTVPELPKDKMTRVAGGVVQVVDTTEENEAHPLYDDQETRDFYEVLPDLRSLVPAVLLGLREDEELESEDKGKSVKEEEEDQKQRTGASHKKLDALLTRLPNCYTRDASDEVAVEFCYMNSKATRKRLIRALCDVPKACLPLLPFYSRIAAILNQIFPDIAAGIVTHLEHEFSALMAKKDPGTYTMESRIRNMRYMGELCKFKLINFGTVFTYLKQLLDDFTHMNIDAACALIETAGNYLIRLPETQARMENRLEQMNRLKNAKNLDSRHRALIENAYYQCKPPKSGIRRKQRPPIHEYIRHLIFSYLNEDNIEEVLKKLRRLPWIENEACLTHCLLKANIKLYSQVPVIAALCRGLSSYHDSLAIRVVDSVFEEIQHGMENPGVGFYQHRVAYIRFFGELYNYQLLNSKTVFEALYWILSFGRTTPEEAQKLDPPDDAFRIKMVCTLLETSGRYFCKGSSKKKLDRFLIYFQRYLLSKPNLSMDIEFEISDVFEKLRPDLDRFKTFEDANFAVEQLEMQDATGEVGSSSGTDADEETVEAGGETEISLEGMDLDDEDDLVEHGRKPAPAPEVDLEFEQDLKALLQEHQKLNVQQHLSPLEDLQSSIELTGTEEKVPFKLLMKRGGKDDKSRQLQVPLTVNLAVRQKENASREAADRQIIKEQILSSNLQDDDDDGFYSGLSFRHGSKQRGRKQHSRFYGGRHYSKGR